MKSRRPDFESYRQALINDIWIVDESYDANFYISDNYKEFGKAPFLRFFGRLQNAYFVDAMILAVGRIFDRRADVISLGKMVSNCADFELKNSHGFISSLKKLNLSDDAIAMVEREGLSPGVANKLRTFVPTEKNCPELKRVIGRRHQDIAHRASSPKKVDDPFFTDIKFCNELAKDWVMCFALGIENIEMRDTKGVYRFSRDARRMSRQMNLLLQHLHLLAPKDNHQAKMIETFYAERIRDLEMSKRTA